jgi:flagellar basal body-associated protein FliL
MTQPDRIDPLSTDPNAPQTPPAPKKKRRRWIWITLASLLILLLLVVALAPTVLASGVGRSMLLPTISKAVAPKGKLEISNWSFGWFSPVKVEGIRITDADGRQLVQANVQTGLTLLGAITGNLDLGPDAKIVADVNDTIDANGKSRLADTLGVYDWPPTTEPARLPAGLKGKVRIEATSTIELPNSPVKTVRVEPGTAFDIDLSNIEAGIGIDGKALVAPQGQQPTTFTVKGTADVIENRAVAIDLTKNVIQLTAGYDRIDGPLLTAIAAMAGQPTTTIDGNTTGTITFDLKPGSPGSVVGKLELTGIDVKAPTGQKLIRKGTLLLNVTVPTGAAPRLVVAGQLEGVSVLRDGKADLDNETVTLNSDVTIDTTQPGITKLTITSLQAAAPSGLIDIKKVGDAPAVVMIRGSAIGGDAQFRASGNLAKLGAIAGLPLQRGVFDSTLVIRTVTEKNLYYLTLKGSASKLDAAPALKNESVSFGIDSYVPTDLSRSDIWGEISSAFATIKLTDVGINLAPGKAPLEMLERATLDGTVASMPKLCSLLHAMAPAQKDVAPLEFVTGSATFNGNVKRDDASKTTNVAFTFNGDSFAIARGKTGVNWAQPVTANVVAQLRNDGPKLSQVEVSKLDANLPNTLTVSMPTPVKLTNLVGGKPDVQGEIALDGQLGPLGLLLQTLQGSETNPIGLIGKLNAKQSIGTTGGGNVITLSGNLDLSRLRPIDPNAQPIPESLQTLAIKNDVVIDLATGRADVRQVQIAAPNEPEALAVTLSGAIGKLGTENVLDAVAVRVQYDLAKLSPLIQPLLREKAENFAAEGKGDETFKLEGSYPLVDSAGKPLPRSTSIRSLSGGGVLRAKRVYYKGADLTAVELPITLKDGIASITYPGKTGRDRFPPATQVNGGQLYLAGMFVDLKTPVPTLSVARDQVIIENMQLNAVLANQLGRYVSVLFTEANKASGIVNVKSIRVDALPLDVASARDQQVGRIEISVDGLYLDGQVPKLLAQALDLGSDGIRGTISGSIVEFSNGLSNSDLSFVIRRTERVRDDKGKEREVAIDLPLRFAGKIDLKQMTLVDTRLEFPTQLIKSREVQKVLGATAVIPIRGALASPQIDWAGFLQENLRKGLLNPGALQGLFGGDKKDGDKK